MLLIMNADSASSTLQRHCTHHAIFTNSAWLCSTVGEHGKTLITTLQQLVNPRSAMSEEQLLQNHACTMHGHTCR
jgi:hypothetical protein